MAPRLARLAETGAQGLWLQRLWSQAGLNIAGDKVCMSDAQQGTDPKWPSKALRGQQENG